MDFTTLFKAPDTESNEKHTPFIERGKGHGGTRDNVVIVTVGKGVPHPNTLEHHIAWVELYGVKKENDQVIYIGRTEFVPTVSESTATFKALDLSQFKALGAISYCNLHGVWKNTLEL